MLSSRDVRTWKKRNREEILHDILKVLKRRGRMRITHLMREAKSPTGSFYRYTRIMTDLGLIEEHNHMWSATEKGEEFLMILGRLIRMVDGPEALPRVTGEPQDAT